MLKKELYDTLKNKRTIIFVVIMIVILLFDLYMVSKNDKLWYKLSNKNEILEMDEINKNIVEQSDIKMVWVSGWIMHPAKASFLSGSASGHLAQILLLWLMPLFVLNLYSDKYISEHGRGYTNALLTRMGRKKLYLSKLGASFIVPALTYAFCLLVNFALTQILFYGGYNFNGMEVFRDEGSFFAFMYDYPNLTYILYILMTSVAAGLCGIICQCFGFLFKKYTIVYLLGFFVWMALVMVKHGIVNLFQPFTEYGLKYILKSGAMLLGVTSVVIVFTYIMKVKRDEL